MGRIASVSVPQYAHCMSQSVPGMPDTDFLSGFGKRHDAGTQHIIQRETRCSKNVLDAVSP